MKAVRLHRYEERPIVDEVGEPEVGGPHDVVVRVGGAGLCRTDLHIIEGQWAPKSNVTLPYTLGHENSALPTSGLTRPTGRGRATVVCWSPVTAGASLRRAARTRSSRLGYRPTASAPRRRACTW
jgi:Alcohol dehydrogenase GroES-like domain